MKGNDYSCELAPVNGKRGFRLIRTAIKHSKVLSLNVLPSAMLIRFICMAFFAFAFSLGHGRWWALGGNDHHYCMGGATFGIWLGDGSDWSVYEPLADTMKYIGQIMIGVSCVSLLVGFSCKEGW